MVWKNFLASIAVVSLGFVPPPWTLDKHKYTKLHVLNSIDLLMSLLVKIHWADYAFDPDICDLTIAVHKTTRILLPSNGKLKIHGASLGFIATLLHCYLTKLWCQRIIVMMSLFNVFTINALMSSPDMKL